jgi:ATP-dependent protease Clp ATPase subunit
VNIKPLKWSEVYCSFCHRQHNEVRVLFTGIRREKFICEGCLALAAEICHEQQPEKVPA